MSEAALFTGVPAEGLDLLARAAGGASWEWIQGRAHDHARFVRGPVQDLCADLHDEFGDAHVYRLHRSPKFWAQQVAVFHRTRDVGFRLELSGEGLVVAGGWWTARSWHREPFRAAAASRSNGSRLERILDVLSTRGWSIDGESLVRVPPPYPPDHPHADLLRWRTLDVHRSLGAPRWLRASRALREVRARMRELSPLVDWLTDVVPERPARPGSRSRSPGPVTPGRRSGVGLAAKPIDAGP